MLQVSAEEVVLYKLPFVTLTVFLLGTAYRTYRYLSKPFRIFPTFPYASGSSSEKAKKYVKTLLLFEPFRGDRALWTLSWLFHLSLAVIVLGHLRMFLGVPIEKSVSQLFGTLFGAIFTVALASLLLRRIFFLRAISTVEDYLVLILLLGIAVSGLYLRASGVDLQGYALSLLRGEYVDVDDPVLVVHALLGQMLVAYLPFGKLFHSIGAFHSNYSALRWKDA